ncbi:glycosyltransferase [Shewanella sp. 6_MG-2023]|uniref:glycosyltransferase n=1 Tax=Shewanella sp. 6_MG-2023 TaxID=3062660 RepID=UPI0026E4185B|nr:glycosyltransferase [Shewanella sp. 6_MG-2023]MDO6617612.1 glycosyltransferase [Shewanella sp. 6_MG-2023]
MRIASIGETDRGGAGLSALKLHNEFLLQGLESKFYVNRKSQDFDDIVEVPNRKGKPSSPFRVGQYTLATTDVPFTTGLSCKCSHFLQNVWEKNDILLLRWSSVTVSDFMVSTWSHRAKPVVWCLSDMAPLTGGCHYSMGCDRYQTACYPCPRIESGFQLPTQVMSRRLKLWEKITIVSPSKWLAKVAKESAIGKNHDIRVIRTGVELNVFKPYEKLAERNWLGLDNEKPVILFGAASLNDSRKGFKFLPELINNLNEKFDLKDKYSVLVIGAGSPDLKQLDCDVHVTGHLTCREELAKAYSAADVTLLPYVEDNLPNVCLESLSCGVPVVAFSIGGIPDVVIPGTNGELARPFDVWDLTNRLVETINRKYSIESIREWSVDNIDIKDQARQYKELFQELISNVNNLNK